MTHGLLRGARSESHTVRSERAAPYQPAMDVPLAWTDAAGQPRALTLRLESHGPASDPDV